MVVITIWYRFVFAPGPVLQLFHEWRGTYPSMPDSKIKVPGGGFAAQLQLEEKEPTAERRLNKLCLHTWLETMVVYFVAWFLQ